MSKKTKNIQKEAFSVDEIIKGMPEVSYVLSKEGRLLTWNKNAEILLGYSKEEMQNKFGLEFVHKGDKERIVQKFLEMLSDGKNYEKFIEYIIETKSGKAIPILAMRSLIVVERVEYVMGIWVDLSKLKIDKEKLKNSDDRIIHLRNRLQDYYCKIEGINQANVGLKETLFLNAKKFNKKLIDNLPGIFYLYEKIEDEFYLKKWNTNFTTDLGYSEDELLNMQLDILFIDKEYKKFEKAIVKIFTTRSVKMEINTTHKNGKQIPYYYQGYHYEDGGRTYFMGVGIDVSAQYALDELRNLREVDKLKAKEELDVNKLELIASALQISLSSKIINYTLKQIDDILVKQEESNFNAEIIIDLKKVKNELKSRITQQNNWEVFKLRFTKLHKDFFSKLKGEHPSITKSELKFCSYLRIHLSSSEISYILNVSKEAIKKTRYRIRKKLELSSKDSLEDYISKY